MGKHSSVAGRSGQIEWESFRDGWFNSQQAYV